MIINTDINIVILCSHLVQPGRGPQPPAERGRAHHQGPEEDRGGGRGQAPGRQPHEGGVGPAEDGELTAQCKNSNKEQNESGRQRGV